MYRTGFCLIIILCLMQIASAQPEIDRLWFYSGDGGSYDSFHDIYAATDGDYLLCGASSYNPWVVRINSEGEVLWEYSENGHSLLSIIQTDNGDAVAVGEIGDNMCGAIRLDSEGNEVWRREYFRGRANAVIELKNNNLLLCGRNREGECGFAMMINPGGEPVWHQS